MYKFFTFPLLLLLISEALHAQNVAKYEMQIPAANVKGSLYNSLKFIDSRIDTTSLGQVQTGAFNKDTKVVPGKPLAVQFATIFKALTDSSVNNGELLLQLRNFRFAEIAGVIPEKGFCFFRAELYARKSDNYQRIISLDTVVMIKSNVDVTKPLLKMGSEAIPAIIAKNLLRVPADEHLYTYNDIVHIDSLEKSAIKLYNTTVYADGVYSTYKSFKDQTPDQQLILEGYEVYPDAVKTKDANGKLQKVKSQSIYAIVYRGEPFIASRYAYYPLKKVNNDFIFTGKARVAADASEVVAATMLFGVLGSLATANNDATFEMKIDHRNGGFIRIREIPEKVYEEQ
jgi:hypothetical protein